MINSSRASHINKIFVSALILVLSLSIIGGKSPEKNTVDRTQKAYFSPNGHIRARIIEEISNSKNSIDIAMFNFTSYGTQSALNKALKRGVKIRIIADLGESEDIHSVIGPLKESGFMVKLVKGKGKNGLMHNKFAIFDRKILLTGSYNWTETAEHYNYENALFLTERSIINEYEKEFDLLWDRA